jgi:hypothetical protein
VAVATTAVTTSSGETAMPASVNVLASSARLCVVVFVMSRNGTSFARSHSIVSIAPGSGSHETTSTPSMSSRTASNRATPRV